MKLKMKMHKFALTQMQHGHTTITTTTTAAVAVAVITEMQNFDCLPHSQFQRRDDKWRERLLMPRMNKLNAAMYVYVCVCTCVRNYEWKMRFIAA